MKQKHSRARKPQTADHPPETARPAHQSRRSQPEDSVDPVPDTPSPGFAIRWEGAFFAWHSLAHVNRELCLALLDTGRVELSILPIEPDAFQPAEYARMPLLAERAFAPLARPAVAHVRHFFPPRFPSPREGHLVLIQPWEFGYLPERWIEPIQRHVSEVWCYSHYVRDVYLASGIPEEKLQVVPLGVDTSVFTPSAPPYIFTTEPGASRLLQERRKRFTFLFAGGTIHRKGIDLLLDAYLRAFSAYDDVCLVVKDTGAQTVYQGMNQRDRILALAEDTSRPQIIYLDADLSLHQMAGVYTACDCLVAPYRGEGFCLPALEAMACGLPVIVTEGGATDDFVDETVGWRVLAKRRALPGGKIGDWPCAGLPWMFEMAVEDLAWQLRAVYANREEAARRGSAGALRAREGWTWEQAAQKAVARLEDLATRSPIPIQRKKPEALTQRPAISPQAEEILIANPGAQSAQAVSTTTWNPTQARHRSAKEATEKSLPASSRISLTMIVRDEERVLADCLASVKEWVDEMIVVDTGSTDRTVAIAESFGATVPRFAWCDSFAAARNEALRHASGDWIFWIDADDTVPPETGEAVRRAAQEAPDEVVGFVIPVQFVEDGSTAAGTRVDHIKLFRNLPGLTWEGRIHEQILASLRKTGRQIGRLDAVVLHSGYDTSPEGQAKKRSRDERLLQLDLQDRPNHPFVLFNLGMNEHYRGSHTEAVKWLRRSLEVSPPTDSHVRKVYALMAASLRMLGEGEQSLAVIQEGLRLFPEDPELNFFAGQALSVIGRFDEAKAHYLRAAWVNISDHFSSVDMGILGFKSWHNVGGVCMAMGDYEEAKRWWMKALDAEPGFLMSAFALFDAALSQSDYPTARDMVTRIYTAEGPSENWASMSVKLEMTYSGPEQAGKLLERAVVEAPEAIGPRLVLVRRLLQCEQEQEAMPHLLHLNEAGVAEAAYFLGVAAIRRNELQAALAWMERALAINPGHLETQQQIGNLKRALGSS